MSLPEMFSKLFILSVVTFLHLHASRTCDLVWGGFCELYWSSSAESENHLSQWETNLRNHWWPFSKLIGNGLENKWHGGERGLGTALRNMYQIKKNKKFSLAWNSGFSNAKLLRERITRMYDGKAALLCQIMYLVIWHSWVEGRHTLKGVHSSLRIMHP